MRRQTKQKLKIYDENTLLLEDKSEVINDYDVCDWKIGKRKNGFFKGAIDFFLKGKNKKLFK